MDRFKDWKRPIIKHGKPTVYQWTIWHPEGLVLGDRVDIGAGSHIFCQHGVEIQDDVQVGGGCFIYSLSTIDDKQGKVMIQKGARIGACSVVMPGVTIGENAVIGACSFVTCDVPPNETWYGVPAKRKGSHVQSKGEELRNCRGLWADRESDCSRAPSVRG